MAQEYSPEVVAGLTRMLGEALPSWGVQPAAEIRLLNLSENATFGVADLIIRVQRQGYSSLSEIRSELAWIQALVEEGIIQTARPVSSVSGDMVVQLGAGTPQARYAVAFTRLPGQEPAPGEALPHWFEVIGGITARMHRHARGWRRPDWFTRKLWNVATMVGEQPHWGPWQASMGLTPEGAAIITQTLLQVTQQLADYGEGAQVFGLVHADLRLANLLLDDDRLQLIDFDDCGFSWYLYDFAASLSFIEHLPEAPALLQAWIRGYGAIEPLSELDLAILPVLSILRRILLTAWLASHAEIPFAMEMGEQFTFDTVSLCRQFLSGTYLSATDTNEG
ncbi:phosphotransferase [Pseudaeromonas sp. ZJS20]|uniref:phosphotransferase enzyme family protein n=1 Tax=Pseudaeromonas aegiceratis TaxID=3153928 RepID=UPI00390C4F5D